VGTAKLRRLIAGSFNSIIAVPLLKIFILGGLEEDILASFLWAKILRGFAAILKITWSPYGHEQQPQILAGYKDIDPSKANSQL
jgi:hypothetical protein